MWKEQYRKANDEIPLNEELLGSLIETAKESRKKRNFYGLGFGTIAAAAIIGICIFSYGNINYEKGDTTTPVADNSEPKTKLVQQPQPALETEYQTEEVLQQPYVVATESAVTQVPVKNDDINEDLANIPATASALMPRMISGEETTEEIPIFEFEQTDQSMTCEMEESDAADETEPSSADEDSIHSEDSESDTEQSVCESPTPSPTPETELTESE